VRNYSTRAGVSRNHMDGISFPHVERTVRGIGSVLPAVSMPGSRMDDCLGRLQWYH